MSGRLEPKDRALIERYPDVPIVDTSTRRLWRRCPRKFAWMAPAPFGRGLRPKQNAPALTFGTLIHDALDLYYMQRWDLRTPEFLAGMFAGCADADLATLERNKKIWPEQIAALEEMKRLGVAMLREYGAYAEQHDDFAVEVTERGALVPVFAETRRPLTATLRDADAPVRFESYYPADVVALYYVRFDGIVKDDRGRLWVLEHKTCKRWWDDAMLTLDDQVSAYVWAAERWYGQPIAGVLMNFLKKEAIHDPEILKSGLPTTDWRKLTYVTADRYRNFLPKDTNTVHDYWGVQARLEERDEEGHPTIKRVKLERTRRQIDEAGERILRDVLRMTDPNRPGEDDPSPEYTCGGCPMKDPCLLREMGADHEFSLRQLYEQRPPIWSDEVGDEDG